MNYEKYLKYKGKYLALKNLVGGACKTISNIYSNQGRIYIKINMFKNIMDAYL